MDQFEEAFFREANAQIRALNDGLLALENDNDIAVNELFREAHSLKGSCHIQGLSEAGDLAHTLEDVLGALRTGDIEPTPTLIDEALEVVDLLEAVIKAAADNENHDQDVNGPKESLRTTLNELRMQPTADTALEDQPFETEDNDDTWDAAESELSDDVIAALEETTEFDDVDALFDNADGDEPDDELDGWGLLDDSDADHEESIEKADEPETPEDPSEFFAKTKAELDEQSATDSLQADIDAIELGEFDDDDNYTIDQLIDLEPDSSSPEVEAPVTDDDETESNIGDTTPTEPELPGDIDVGDVPVDTASDHASTDQPTADAAGESATAGDDSSPSEAPISTADDQDVDEAVAHEFVFEDPQEEVSTSEGVTVDGESSISDESVTPESDPAGSSVSTDVPDPDSVPEMDLGIDLSGDLDMDGDDWDSDAQLDVAVDEEMAAFESRFEDLLSGRAGETADRNGPTLRFAVNTIEESRLDAEDFPMAESTDAPLGPGEFDRLQEMTVDVDTADQLLNVAEELSLTHLRLDEAVGPETDPAISEEVSNLLRVVTEYRRTVMDVRLMPLRTAVENIPRTVRDIARSQDKEVNLDVDETDVELDRGIIDELRDPLVHIARNAVDHGIEPTDDRVAAGKPPKGTIEIRAERRDDTVVIEVSDDGRGIEPEAVRQRAVDKGVLSRKEARRLADDEVYDLLFEPGFTTRDEVTDVSGRGVGMDVVNRTIADLNGTVTIDSTPGDGTTIRLRVPVSIVFTEILFIEVNQETFGIPMAVVEQITPTPPIQTADGRDVVRQSDLDMIGSFPDKETTDDAYPLIRLQAALGLQTCSAPDDDGQVIWVDAENDRFAIQCDRVVTSREVVVRPYGDLLRDVPGVSGATTLGDGEAVNVLDVGSI